MPTLLTALGLAAAAAVTVAAALIRFTHPSTPCLGCER